MPSKPVLPTIESARLASLDDETFWALMDRERRIVDWAMDMRATLETLCGERQ